MMELMERESSIHRPTQVSLARPEVWKDEWGIKDFLDATKTEPLGKLKDVSTWRYKYYSVLRNSIISSQESRIESNSSRTCSLR